MASMKPAEELELPLSLLCLPLDICVGVVWPGDLAKLCEGEGDGGRL